MKKLALKVLKPVALALLLSGCSTFQKPPEIPDGVKARYSTGLPNAVVTNFNEALACMDDLMLINQVTPIYISSPPINNYTSDRSISSGATEMLITALAKMAIRSGGVRYVSFGPEVQNVLTLQGAHPNNKEFRAPDFFIRGGVTQFNKSLWNGQRGAGASAQIDAGEIIHGGTFFMLRGQEDVTASISRDKAFGTLTMDLNAGFIANLQMIPGVASSNTLALEAREGSSLTGDLSLAGLGLSYSFSETVSNDFNQVLRSLIEVGAIEIVGKLQGVPYWRCLANAGTVEKRDAALREIFIQQGRADEAALLRSAQQALKEMRYYKGEINGRLDAATQEALQHYQSQMGLLSTGLLNFETFRMLNVYTPARTGPYVQWWQNTNAIERVVAPRVPRPVAPSEAARPAAAAEPAKPADAKPATAPEPAAAKSAAKADNKPADSKPEAGAAAGSKMEKLTISAPTTLRLFARGYIPDPEAGTARARLIRRIAAANPELFPNAKEAFDQRLPAGQLLLIPEGLLPAQPGKSK